MIVKEPRKTESIFYQNNKLRLERSFFVAIIITCICIYTLVNLTNYVFVVVVPCFVLFSIYTCFGIPDLYLYTVLLLQTQGELMHLMLFYAISSNFKLLQAIKSYFLKMLLSILIAILSYLKLIQAIQTYFNFKLL